MTIILIIFSAACKEAYDPPVISTDHSFLVVEGFINNGPDSTLITLSHTYKLNDSAKAIPELNAQVTVEGNDNSSYPISETGNGNYGVPNLTLSPAAQYRLYIKTSAGKEYRSDFVPLKTSPPIDSVNWKRTGDGVEIYANTHDPQNASTYYMWNYTETWQFHSIYYSEYKYLPLPQNIIVPRDVDTFYTCWKSQHSTSVLLGSSARLVKDVIYEAPLAVIPNGSWHLSVEYSTLVKQYALTKDGYNFWLNLQRNTEQIGTIFSPQPSGIKGNIHSVSDPGEDVIGYISAGTLQKQRIFINADSVSNWIKEDYPNSCSLFHLREFPDSLMFALGGINNFIPVDRAPVQPPHAPPFVYDIAEAYCVDCTELGINHKPAFWP